MCIWWNRLKCSETYIICTQFSTDCRLEEFLLIKLVIYYLKKQNLIIITIIHLLCKNFQIAKLETSLRQLIVTHFIFYSFCFPIGDIGVMFGRFCKMIITNWVVLGPYGTYKNIIYPLNWLDLGWNYDYPKQIKMENIFLEGSSTVIKVHWMLIFK